MSDDERRRVAEGLRDVARTEGGPLGDIGFTEAMHRALGGGGWRDMTERLADLIDPDTATDTTKPGPDTTKAPTSSDTAPTRTDANETCDMSQSCRDTVACGIDYIYDWCFERIEGADGAEDYMLCSIMSAIEEYRHPERVTARTARPVDREALLALADELEQETGSVCGVCMGKTASRIREACGEEGS